MRVIRLALLTISVLVSSLIFAQTNKVSTSVGASFLIPVNNLQRATVGHGVDVSSVYSLSKTFGVTLSTGYNWLYTKNNGVSTHALPIKGGFQVVIAPKTAIQGEAGIVFFTKSGTNAFTYAGGIGYQVSKKVTVSARYEGWERNNSSFGVVGLRVSHSL